VSPEEEPRGGARHAPLDEYWRAASALIETSGASARLHQPARPPAAVCVCVGGGGDHDSIALGSEREIFRRRKPRETSTWLLKYLESSRLDRSAPPLRINDASGLHHEAETAQSGGRRSYTTLSLVGLGFTACGGGGHLKANF